MKVAVVTVRFGEEIVGGAEKLALEVCRRLSGEFEFEILTTCAKNYRTWENEFPEGVLKIGGLRTRRFPVKKQRRWKRFGRLSSMMFRLNRVVRLPSRLEKWWLIRQGPFCPQLVSHLRDRSNRYDRVLFITSLYYPTVAGLPPVREKAVLVPTAHDEPAMNFGLYHALMQMPRFILFLSREEKDFVHQRFGNRHIPFQVAGIGVEIRKPAGRSEDFLLYIGRIEPGKNCGELFEFCRQTGLPLKAVGSAQMPVPDHVEFRGFVDEEEKCELVERCRAVVIPSLNESLSIVALDAWAQGKPVIVHGDSPVLSGHVRRSGGGYIYRNLEEFKTIVTKVDSAAGLKGREYVRKYYTWEKILPAYRQALLA